jgi:hypothetical protein
MAEFKLEWRARSTSSNICSDGLAQTRALSYELAASLTSAEALAKLREEAPDAYASVLVGSGVWLEERLCWY